MTADAKYEGAMRSYKPDIEQLPADFQHLLETYSKIPADRAVAHVNAVVRVYCITEHDIRINNVVAEEKSIRRLPIPMYRTMEILGAHLPQTSEVPNHSRSIEVRSDILRYGMLFRTRHVSSQYHDRNIFLNDSRRQMIADGVPSDRLYGIEIEKELVDIGYDLFSDFKTNKAKFMIGDALNPGTSFDALNNSIDIINDSAFTHLWPWHDQRKVCTMMAGFSRPGAMIVGRMTGSLKPAEYPALVKGTTGWRHNVESLQRLWDEVGEATGTKWKAHGTMDLEGIFPVPDGTPKDQKELPVWWEPNVRRLLFWVERLD